MTHRITLTMNSGYAALCRMDDEDVDLKSLAVEKIEESFDGLDAAHISAEFNPVDYSEFEQVGVTFSISHLDAFLTRFYGTSKMHFLFDVLSINSDVD